MKARRPSGPRRAMRHGALAALVASALVAACGWDPSRPFEREAPPVRAAIAMLDGGDAQAASSLLEEYLTTGPCAEGNIGTPNRLHERPNGTFDLGLALFAVAESFGHRLGDEEGHGGAAGMLPGPGLPGAPGAGAGPESLGAGAGFIECALRVVRAIAEDATQPVDLRARAFYLRGNLLFLDAKYKEAVEAYDRALELAPGMADAGPLGARDGGAAWSVDPIGRDAAWNRAVALRRIEDKKDAGQDASPEGDGGNDRGDGGDKDDRDKDAGRDGGGGKDDRDDDAGPKPPPDAGGNDSPDAAPPPPKQDREDAGPPPPSRANQDERVLDQLEAAPTVQQEAARRTRHAPVRGAADK